jgi:N-methylhydantoinase B/oxoprolinase/acetone carboxylase alpha subunit
MNNPTLAGEGFAYYETLGGGQGACPDADGPSAIHVAMSNTLNTPIEALERVWRVASRARSGRTGSCSGGNATHCVNDRRLRRQVRSRDQRTPRHSEAGRADL